EVPPPLRQRRGRRDRTVSSAEGTDLKDRIAAWLGRGGDRLAPEAAATLRSLVEAAPAFEDAPQRIHRDVRSAYTLVDASAIRSEVPPPLRQRRGRRDRTVSSAEGTDLKDRIAAWLGRGGDRLAPEAAATLRSLVEAAPAFEDAPQLIHRDFRSANILVDGSAI